MSDAPRPPRKPEVRPGENIWLAMAREVVTHPDSPASLQLLSKVNEAMRPRTQAGDQLTEALADQIDLPDDAATEAAVAAAIAHWEKACGCALDPDLLDLFRQDATALAARRRRQPPPLEAIVAGTQERSDVGYQLRVHLEGLRGTWHVCGP